MHGFIETMGASILRTDATSYLRILMQHAAGLALTNETLTLPG